MVKLFSLFLIIMFGLTASAQHKLVKLWETSNPIDLPESVLHDPKSGLLYVSIMGNSSDAKDSIGGIGILDTNGKEIDLAWITGLNAPKGLAIYGDLLYIADITDVVTVNIPQRKVIDRMPVEGAVFLNDVTVSDKGVVYISDSRTKRIHQLDHGKLTLFLENIDGVNGLKSIGNTLYIAGGGKGMIKADGDKNLTKVASLPHGGDGIEPVGNGDFIYSSWAGYIYYVYADGRFELLLDTHLEKINTADIGYDPVKRIIYVPTFFKKSVMAYQLH